MAYDNHNKKDAKDKIRIDITDGFAVERALKKFKRLCDAYGIVKEYRAREAYKKPSVKQKEKLEDAEKRRKKTNSKTRGSKKI
jgi:small subunit ribosomal protein S21